ncbi:DUF3987 domain-containing protein [Methylococcus sp. ANG]|uniref:YfjI family protein n=1 Tax=Methylococcus sp. ANG TaxID=3231903 RepID=UPI003459650E
MTGIPQTFNSKPLKWAWQYSSPDGSTLGVVARYEDQNGKTVIPFFKQTETGGWAAGASPDPRPLFGLDVLSGSDRRAALVVEGEKCAAALQSLGLPAITSQGGSKSASKADWAPLSGIVKIYLLPDCDGPGEGYAKDVCRELAKLPAPPEVLIVRLPDLPPAGDVADWIQSRCPKWDGFRPVPEDDRERLMSELRAAIKTNAEPVPAGWTQGESFGDCIWPEPISLEAAVLPDWPRGAFSEGLDDFVHAVAASTETPVELPALFTLAALATAAQGRFEVEIKPGYREPLCLWTCPALPPGSRKTAVKSIISAPLTDWERKQRAEMEPEIKRSESDHKTQTARIEALRKVAAKAKGPEFDQAKAEIAELEASLPEIPKPPRVWADDITPENLGTIMADNRERMAILSDEAGLFEMMAGRYSGGVPNLDVYLQGHAGTAVRVDRGSRPPVFMQNATLTIGISPQPEVLRGLTEKPSFRGRGLLARFLYALPPSNLGQRTGDTKPVPGYLAAGYAGRIEAILNAQPATDENGTPCPHTLNLNPEAYAAWSAFWLKTEAGMGPGGTFEHCTDWAGKLPGAVARIAGLLHVARNVFRGPEKLEIGIEDMDAAIRIADALSAHALAVFDLMGADPALDGARHVLRWIQRQGFRSFTFRDCHAAHKSRFRRASELEPAVEVLIERGHIKPTPTPPGPMGGRPSRTYQVNPMLSPDRAE